MQSTYDSKRGKRGVAIHEDRLRRDFNMKECLDWGLIKPVETKRLYPQEQEIIVSLRESKNTMENLI